MLILSTVFFVLGFLLIIYDGTTNAFHEWWLMGLGAVFIVLGLLCIVALV